MATTVETKTPSGAAASTEEPEEVVVTEEVIEDNSASTVQIVLLTLASLAIVLAIIGIVLVALSTPEADNLNLSGYNITCGSLNVEGNAECKGKLATNTISAPGQVTAVYTQSTLAIQPNVYTPITYPLGSSTGTGIQQLADLSTFHLEPGTYSVNPVVRFSSCSYQNSGTSSSCGTNQASNSVRIVWRETGGETNQQDFEVGVPGGSANQNLAPTVVIPLKQGGTVQIQAAVPTALTDVNQLSLSAMTLRISKLF